MKYKIKYLFFFIFTMLHYNGGLGFTIFRFADSNLFFDGTTNQSNYGIIKYGLNRSIYKDKLSINVDVFH